MLDVSTSDLLSIRTTKADIIIPIKYFAILAVSFKLSKKKTDSQPAVPEVPITSQEREVHNDPVHVLVQGKSQYYNKGFSYIVIITPPSDKR